MEKDKRFNSIIEVFSNSRIQYFDNNSYQYFCDAESHKIIDKLKNLELRNLSIPDLRDRRNILKKKL